MSNTIIIEDSDSDLEQLSRKRPLDLAFPISNSGKPKTQEGSVLSPPGPGVSAEVCEDASEENVPSCDAFEDQLAQYRAKKREESLRSGSKQPIPASDQEAAVDLEELGNIVQDSQRASISRDAGDTELRDQADWVAPFQLLRVNGVPDSANRSANTEQS